jgi:hypothetical protein
MKFTFKIIKFIVNNNSFNNLETEKWPHTSYKKVKLVVRV